MIKLGFGLDCQRIKAVDCKTLSIMLTDLLRHRNVLKLTDDDYIFVRRSKAMKDTS